MGYKTLTGASVLTPIRVESRDPRGRTVATAELIVSLSCLGAAGALFQLNNPTATASHPPRVLGTAAVVPPFCTPGIKQDNSPRARNPESGASGDGEGEETERQRVVAGKRGRYAFTGERTDQMTPPVHGDGGRSFAKQEPGDVSSWTCEFNPHDGSLTEVAASRVTEAPGIVLDAGALGLSEHAEGKRANDGEEPGIAARPPEDNKNPAAGTFENRTSPSFPGSSVSVPVASKAATAAASAAAVEAADLKLAARVATTSVPAVINSEPDRVPPLPRSEGEGGDSGGADTRVVQTGEEVVGALETADDFATEETARVAVLPGRKTAGRVFPGVCMCVFSRLLFMKE